MKTINIKELVGNIINKNILIKMYDVVDEVIKKIKPVQNSQCNNQWTWRLLNLNKRNYSNGKQKEKK